jgi:hypothetical protein
VIASGKFPWPRKSSSSRGRNKNVTDYCFQYCTLAAFFAFSFGFVCRGSFFVSCQQCCRTMLSNNVVEQCCRTMLSNNVVEQCCRTMMSNNDVEQ